MGFKRDDGAGGPSGNESADVPAAVRRQRTEAGRCDREGEGRYPKRRRSPDMDSVRRPNNEIEIIGAGSHRFLFLEPPQRASESDSVAAVYHEELEWTNKLVPRARIFRDCVLIQDFPHIWLSMRLLDRQWCLQ